MKNQPVKKILENFSKIELDSLPQMFFPYSNELLRKASTLYEKVKSDHLFDNEMRQLALLQYLNFCVSWIENHYKTLFILCVDIFELSSDNVMDKIDRKLSFAELHSFSSSNVTFGSLAAEYVNFQNIYDIEHIFTKMLIDCQHPNNVVKGSFFTNVTHAISVLREFSNSLSNEELDQISTKNPHLDLIKIKSYPEIFYNFIRDLFEFRHMAVHDTYTLLDDPQKIEQVTNLISGFESLSSYLISFEISLISMLTGKENDQIQNMIKTVRRLEGHYYFDD